MAEKPSRMVYSTDAAQNRRCPRCGEVTSNCRCAPEEDVAPSAITAVLRIEKAGRGGKTVTVIAKLPRSENFLKTLSSELKAKCGTGGTYAVGATEGMIEIQGDKRDVVRAALTKKGMKVKG